MNSVFGLALIAACLLATIQANPVDPNKYLHADKDSAVKFTHITPAKAEEIDVELLKNVSVILDAKVALTADKKVVLVDAKSVVTLENLLTKTKTYDDQNEKDKTPFGKGLKLEFEDVDALSPAAIALKPYNDAIFPIWIGANVAKGPAGGAPLDYATLAKALADNSLTNVVLSLGWTVSGKDGYSKEQIKDMVDLLKDVKQTITFQVNAVNLGNTTEDDIKTLKTSGASTLTIVTDANVDEKDINFDQVNKVIKAYGQDKVFADVSDAVLKKLSFNASTSVQASLFLICATVGAALLRFMN